MGEKQTELFQKVVSLQENLSKEAISYWRVYSNTDTWQFWFILAMFVGPLIFVYFKIDREKIFQIGFYGFTTHVLFSYVDAIGIRLGLWGYPYQIIPFLPSLSLDAAFIPVVIMLVYQYTLNKKKNFYLYAFISALFFGFYFKPLLTMLGLFEYYKWINYFYIFIIYITLFLLPYFLTNFFIWMQKKRLEH